MAKRYLLTIATGLLILSFFPPLAMAGKKKEMAFAADLARKGLWQEATHRFQALVEKNPHNPRLWNNLAVAHEAAGHFQQAHEAYQKASELDHDDESILANWTSFDSFYRHWSGNPESDAAASLADPNTPLADPNAPPVEPGTVPADGDPPDDPAPAGGEPETREDPDAPPQERQP